jgi:deazaflavin-dependent oxidoreductase (nitroreductase family)
MSDTTISPDLPNWIQDHMRRYIESDGADGHMWDSTAAGGSGVFPTLLLTTTGRRSGESRTLPLIYGETDGGYVIIASKGGFPSHPVWYLNLVAKSEVGLQVGSDHMRASARIATGDERTALWAKMVGIYSPYTAYQANTEREIPVVVLERVED